MNEIHCRLEARWTSITLEEGRLEFELFNLGDASLADFRLSYTSLTRIEDASKCENATLLRRNANLHEMMPVDGKAIAPGKSWRFGVGGLTRPARHRTDGVSTAYITLADGSRHDIALGPFLPSDSPATFAPELVPEGELEFPVSILPWPKKFSAMGFGAPPVALFAQDGSSTDKIAALSEISELAARLFPAEAQPFSLCAVTGGRPIRFEENSDLAGEGYTLSFSVDEVKLASAGHAGTIYGLVTLVQMLMASHREPEKFSFPASGNIEDAPRYQWRGCHLDVSRQVYPLASVARFIDILAWNKLNVLHWHLTDDEGWRLEIKAYPELTEIGARRGPDEIMTAQLGTGARTTAGHYTQQEVRELVAKAKRINVDIMPEIDIPGHCTALLAALPDLTDGQEAPESYFSVQGYSNNSINPGLPQTFEFLEKVFSEVAQLFPFPYIHVGGDEVAPGAWLASPKAKDLMAKERLGGTPELQAYLLRRVKTMLSGMGKQLSGWDEVSHGGGVDPEGTLLMAWQKAELGPELAEQGYDVVMTPGQAYYLDMVQSEDWQEPGLNWAARKVPPKLTYEYEAAGEFPEPLSHKLKGIQGCIWSENLVSRELFNHMVFPRLSAIAESAWTPRDKKNWQRFAATCRRMPVL